MIPTPRPRRWGRRLAWVAGALVLVLLAAAGSGYAWARRSLPVVTGELRLAALKTPVAVYRDSRGVPTIVANSEHDLYVAQGFVTAQDRLFQMDLTRRAAAGQLAEVMGEGQLNTDKFFRALNLRRAAEESLKVIRPEARALLEAYASGVNAYLEGANAAGRLPVEFTILGYRPEPWTAIDSIIIGKIMAYDLGGNFTDEVFRLQLRQKVGLDLADQLMPVYPADAPTMLKFTGWDGEAPRALAAQALDEAAIQVHAAAARPPHVGGTIDLAGLVQAAKPKDPWLGSNNWVVSGRLTATGKPLLANDPHLGMRTPSIWYEQHLVVADPARAMNAYGVIFPGAPGIVIGQNEQIAWGVTNTGPDVQDLYVERRNPDNPYQFLYKGRWEDATVHKELIPVKGKPPVEFEVVVTRHGPIISEVVGSEKNRPEEALALQWTAHLGTPELEAVLAFPRARTWTEFREALKLFQAPTQNFVFASVDGTIAYRTGGLIPIRTRGDGLVPMPGWTGEYEWTGFIPFDKMPEVVNPPEGLIVTANHKVIDDAYPYLISRSWAPPYRAMRINEVLKAKQGLTADDMQALQVDVANLHARTTLPILLPLLQGVSLSKTESQALALIEGWDLVDSADQGAPLVYQLWWRHLTRQLYQPVMGEDLYKRMADVMNVTDQALKEAAAGSENDWIKQAGGLKQLAVSSFQAAVKEATALQGTNPARWAWGKFHITQPPHPIGGAVKPLGWILNPKARPMNGSGVSVGVASFRANGTVSHSAPWRQVVDLADPTGNSRSIVTPGQSGHFLSRWYDNQSKSHNEGKLFTRQIGPDNYRQGQRLLLKP